MLKSSTDILFETLEALFSKTWKTEKCHKCKTLHKKKAIRQMNLIFISINKIFPTFTKQNSVDLKF